MFVQSFYGEGGWAQNLRVAGEATLTEHDRVMPVKAVELPPKRHPLFELRRVPPAPSG